MSATPAPRRSRTRPLSTTARRRSSPRRVLIATDGSRAGRRAELLAGSVAWRDRAKITLLRVDAPLPGDRDLSPTEYVALHERMCEEIERDLRALKREIHAKDPRASVATLVLPGIPAEVIIDQARALLADLVIVGSRGHGAVASAVLGSVAAEVTDRAPCPVLVARTTRIRRILVADDGSDAARQAQEVIAGWPFLRGLPIRVVSVADTSPLVRGFGSGVTVGVHDERLAMLDEMSRTHQAYAQEAAKRLRGLDPRASCEMRQGPVVEGILAAAADAGADLIVVGTHGRTGLTRILLGSVARALLFDAPVSVLIVRPKSELPARSR